MPKELWCLWRLWKISRYSRLLSAALHGGRRNSMVNGVVRSASVPIADFVQTDDEISFLMSKNSAVIGLGGTFTDHDLGGYGVSSDALGPSSRDSERTSRTPAGPAHLGARHLGPRPGA